ncbi:hypothetical protein C0585_03705 [Candidatus Woesearchaeota archaeon]|nr:MAG: hypothetical protein C0585_03705 [Candidatus Woesearchaeota archaeon]
MITYNIGIQYKPLDIPGAKTGLEGKIEDKKFPNFEEKPPYKPINFPGKGKKDLDGLIGNKKFEYNNEPPIYQPLDLPKNWPFNDSNNQPAGHIGTIYRE